MNCETCMNSRPILSENGWHHNCTLSSKKAIECFKSQKYYVPHPAQTPIETISQEDYEELKKNNGLKKDVMYFVLDIDTGKVLDSGKRGIEYENDLCGCIPPVRDWD